MAIIILCAVTAEKITAQNLSKENEGSALNRFKRSLSNASTESEIKTLLQEMDEEIVALKNEMKELKVYQERNMELVYVFVAFNLSVKNYLYLP